MIFHKKLFHIVLCVLLLLPCVSFFSKQLHAADEIPSPTIVVNPDIYYPLDEILYVEGRSTPVSSVELRLSKQGSKPQTFTARSDHNGEWVFAEKVPLDAGDWEMRARLRLDDLYSEWSNPRVFKVVQNGITIGGINIKFAALSLIIFVLLLIGGIIVFYFSFRVRRLRELLMTKEVREAHESVREGVSDLRADVLEELRLMESSKKKLSRDEIARKEHLLKELGRIEKNMEREIGDIEDKMR